MRHTVGLKRICAAKDKVRQQAARGMLPQLNDNFWPLESPPLCPGRHCQRKIYSYLKMN